MKEIDAKIEDGSNKTKFCHFGKDSKKYLFKLGG
jgi:hypothetical protein